MARPAPRGAGPQGWGIKGHHSTLGWLPTSPLGWSRSPSQIRASPPEVTVLGLTGASGANREEECADIGRACNKNSLPGAIPFHLTEAKSPSHVKGNLGLSRETEHRAGRVDMSCLQDCGPVVEASGQGTTSGTHLYMHTQAHTLISVVFSMALL